MKLLNTIIILVCFGVYYALFERFGEIKTKLDAITGIGLLSYIATYFLIGLPLFAGTFFVNRTQFLFCTLGLCGNFVRGLGLAFLFSVPMFLGGAILFEFVLIQDLQQFLAKTIIAGFFEELYFRGFLFGFLFRYSRLGFIPSAIAGAVVFGLGHLWQGSDAMNALGVFAITFMGAILFAWLFAEWKFNLWLPIFLHTFMNTAWEIFSMDDNALGGTYANALRALTIASAIIFTIKYKRKKALMFEVNRSTLWLSR